MNFNKYLKITLLCIGLCKYTEHHAMEQPNQASEAPNTLVPSEIIEQASALETPLSSASQANPTNAALIKFLLDNNADPNIHFAHQDSNNKTGIDRPVESLSPYYLQRTMAYLGTPMPIQPYPGEPIPMQPYAGGPIGKSTEPSPVFLWQNSITTKDYHEQPVIMNPYPGKPMSINPIPENPMSEESIISGQPMSAEINQPKCCVCCIT